MRVNRDIAEIDIWRSAKRLVGQHGDDAPLVAAQRADELLARGDVEGQAVWKRILRAIEELARVERGDGEKVS